jgi:ABC-type branched-subunit amino acid transport system substrate-binding protein
MTFEYQVGGSLHEDSLSYVTRQADRELYRKLIAGHFCYVLQPRQVGKSSLAIQTKARLQAEGIACASVDLTILGNDESTTPDTWYIGILRRLEADFNLKHFERKKWWKDHDDLSVVHRFHVFINEVLLPQTDQKQKLVIFIDEIDSILGLKFSSDDFFSAIRVCHNRRADYPAYKRLTFCLLGVTTPQELIRDKLISPFNIGQKIELGGFRLDEARHLAQGLVNTANSEIVLKEILKWTGGQPYLTQKLCRLVIETEDRISAGQEGERIEQLVEKQIIENWEYQDEPVHLRTVRDRILGQAIVEELNLNTDDTIRSLKLYERVLLNNEVPAIESPETIRLQLSGVLINQQGKLRVANPIYRAIFNQEWIKAQLSTFRPYSQQLIAWFKSKCQDNTYLLRGQKLQEASNWAEGRSLADEDYQFLNASLKAEKDAELAKKNVELDEKKAELSKKEEELGEAEEDNEQLQKIADRELKRQKNRKRLVLILATCLFGFSLYQLNNWWQDFAPCLPNRIRAGRTCNIPLPAEKFSSGERTLFSSQVANEQVQGMEAFRLEKYSEARQWFERAVSKYSRAPEPQIYLNNSLARQKGTPYILAVSLPTDTNPDSAKEMLRGIADAQTEFNEDSQNTRLVEILLVNDSNDPTVAPVAAKQLSGNPRVLGVIGPNSSDASLAALPEYEKANLAMVAPTSTSTDLKGDVFFRTIPSDQASSRALAKYIADQKIQNVALFSDQSSYSTSVSQSFEAWFGGSILNKIDFQNMAQFSLDIFNTQGQQVQALALFPSVGNVPGAIAIARANTGKLRLFGSDTLYTPSVLVSGGEAVNGMVLVVPWFAIPGSGNYAERADERWKGQVSWRTASSYDAAQALFATLSENVTRAQVLQRLRNVSLPAIETSGESLRFDKDGERVILPRLVEVSKDAANKPKESELGFKLLK